jgi:DNA repair protein RadC
MLNTSRLGVLLDAEEEFDNLVAQRRRGSAPGRDDLEPPGDLWTPPPRYARPHGLAEDAAGVLCAPVRFRSGRSNAITARALEIGGRKPADRSLLDVLLYLASPQLALSDAAPWLLARFGTLRGVLSARESELGTIPGMSRPAIELFARIRESMEAGEQALGTRPVLSSPPEVRRHLDRTSGDTAGEQTRILLLDRENRLCHEEVSARGSTDELPLHPCAMLRLCLERGASAAIMVHLAPRGRIDPSPLDAAVTRQIARGLATMDVLLHDRLVIDRRREVSLCEGALLH